MVMDVCREDYRRRQVGECADTWYKQIRPTETVDPELYSCPAICQRACVNHKRTMSLLYCCFVTFIIDIGAQLNLLKCLRVICGCKAVQ